MKNRKYLTEQIPPKVRLALYRKALRLLKEDANKYQEYYGYGLCIMLRNILFDTSYRYNDKDNTIIIKEWWYDDTKNRLIELTQDRICSITTKQFTTFQQIEQRIIVLEQMINELKQLINSKHNI